MNTKRIFIGFLALLIVGGGLLFAVKADNNDLVSENIVAIESVHSYSVSFICDTIPPIFYRIPCNNIMYCCICGTHLNHSTQGGWIIRIEILPAGPVTGRCPSCAFPIPQDPRLACFTN